MTKNIPVSIVIPTYNRYKELLATLNSLKKQTFKDFEVVIADDGGSDETSQLQKKNFPFTLKYQRQKNSGRAAARNLGIAAAKGDIIIFIDDHIIVTEKFVEEHYQAHQKYKNKDVGVIRGRVEFIKTPEDVPKRLKKPKKHLFDFYNVNSPFNTFITNNISVSRLALELSGGFDPDFKEYGFQDQELGYRLRQRGFKFRVNNNAIGFIFSVAQVNTEQRLDKHRQAGRSAALFYRKHFWGGLQLGVNPFNLFLYKILALGDNRLEKYLRLNMQQQEGVSRQKFDFWFYKLRYLYFLKGIQEGLVKYPEDVYTPHSGKNVVMLVSHQADLSGAPISLVILANNLRAYGYVPILVLPAPGPVASRIQEDKVVVLYLKGFSKYLSLTDLVRRFRPAIIHANTFLTEYALDVAAKFKIRKIIHVREDLTEYPRITARLSRKADRIILISNSMIKDFADPYKLDVIYNGLSEIPPENFSPAQEEAYNLLYVGSIERRKGLLDLVQAVKIIAEHNKRVRLTVLGRVLPTEKLYWQNIQNYIRKNQLSEQIIFAGTAENIDNFMDKASLVVVPSHAEPFGRVVIEAMARKKLVVGTTVGGIPEIIDQYHNGFLVKPDNPEELAKTIMYVWAKPEAQKLAIKERAYATVKEKFTAEVYVSRIAECYKKLFLSETAEQQPVLAGYWKRENSGPVSF